MPAQSPDHLNMSPTRDESPDNIDTLKKQRLARAQNEIGAKVLTLAGFESRQKDIVESSFDKARKNKEKLPGKNNERRNFAYLSRLDSMIEKHGDPLEKRLWKASVDNVIIKPENITDAYWEQREQNRRDDGQGRELSFEEKEDIIDGIIKNQQRTISAWSDYLGDKDCPYPTWFKVYAFDGISRMGLLGKETKEFEKRDKSTVAGFPKFNAEVLAKVYRNINEFYGISKEKWLEDHPDDDKLLSLVRSGNFAKLYAKELFNRKVIVKTPERTEDIKGDWFEYGPGDEEQIADLAEGTGWCVADPYIAQGYLEYGKYIDEYDNHSKNEEYDSKARFILFRLEDPDSPGNYAASASASIRLGADGKVAEVSGLDDEQEIGRAHV